MESFNFVLSVAFTQGLRDKAFFALPINTFNFNDSSLFNCLVKKPNLFASRDYFTYTLIYDNTKDSRDYNS